MNIGLIFAGGSGVRMNTKGLPKQFLEMNGKAIIIHTIEHFEKCKAIDAIVIVCLKDYIEYLEDLLDRDRITKVKKIVPGGSCGQESIYHGLCAAEEISESEDDIILIHDGVRPLISGKLIYDNINMVKEKGNAITVTPATETIIQVAASQAASKAGKVSIFFSASVISRDLILLIFSSNVNSAPVAKSCFFVFSAIMLLLVRLCKSKTQWTYHSTGI